jgi:Domain of unknown function (DUF4864)
MKIFLIALLVIILLALVILFFVFQLTGGITKVADQFFSAVKEKDFTKAYSFTSQDFQASTSLEDLQRFLEGTALLDYQDASWGSRSVSGSQGELDGSIKTSSGGTIPVKITLVKENGGWKILNIHKADAGLLTDQSLQLPAESVLIQLVNSTMQDLAQAINSKDFGNFHQKISRLWQSQITKEELYDIFQSFSDQNIDLTVLEGIDPVFSEKPLVNAENLLMLTGYYPTQPSVTYFTLKYTMEYPNWKLFGINVELK